MNVIDKVTSGIFKNTGGTLMEDAFGYKGATLLGYLDNVFSDGSSQSDVLKYFYQQMYRDFVPDINGYTLIFFIPPHLSGYEKLNNTTNLYRADKDSYMGVVGKIMTFAAVDFTPPQSQIRTENVSTRSGSIPIAAEVSESDSCSITFIDNANLDIYMFHHIWVEYIREVLEGTIEPNPAYYQSPDEETTMGDFYSGTDSVAGDNYGAIDYAASCYIVKYRPDMKTVTFAAKCVGIFPQGLPNKELIGSRAANEIVTLPFTYSCSGYRECLHMEQGTASWIFSELNEIVLRFASTTAAGGGGTIGGSASSGSFLGRAIETAIGPTSSMLDNLTQNAAKLGGIVAGVQPTISNAIKAVTGFSQNGTAVVVDGAFVPESTQDAINNTEGGI